MREAAAGRCSAPPRRADVPSTVAAARRAIEEYASVLRDAPDESTLLGARWLLNLAYMAAGEYPLGVPEEWLVPPGAFRSGLRRREVRRRRSPAGPRRGRPQGGQRHGRLRRRWRPRPLHLLGRPVRRRHRGQSQPAPLFPQRGRRDVHRPDGGSRARGARQRPEPRAGRLRQRRVPRPAGAARCVAERPAPQLAAAQQRRRDLLGRHRAGGVVDSRPDAGRGVGRLRQRRLGRSLRRQRVGGGDRASRQPVPQQSRRHVHRRGVRGRRGRRRLHQGRRVGGLRQRRPARSLRDAAAPRRAEPAVPQRRAGAGPRVVVSRYGGPRRACRDRR